MEPENHNKASVPSSRCFAVTGAAGFIGGRLSQWLLSHGHKVIAIVRDGSQGDTLAALGAEIRVADIRDSGQLRAALRDADGVFHLAALFNHPDRSWEEYRDVNVQGTLNVLEAARNLGIPRVVHSSTVGVATEAEPPPYSERTPYSPQPDDKYEVTKCEGEIAARAYAAKHGTSLVVIRPAQVYGPGDRSKTKFYKLVKKGVIVAPGKTRKHLIFIDDLCESFFLAMDTPAADGEIFLIAGDSPILLEELVTIAADALRVSPPRLRLPARPVTMTCALVERVCNALGIKPILFRRSMDFFTRTVVCDVSKAREQLGFRSRTAVGEGVRKTVQWYREEDLI